MPSRSTPKYAFGPGSPCVALRQVLPAFPVFQTAICPLWNTRFMAPMSGVTKAVPFRSGWAAIGNPKSDGRPLVISVHAPPSGPRWYVPVWFCWKSEPSPEASHASLWTHCPHSGYGFGRKPARTPRFSMVHERPASRDSKAPTALIPMTRCFGFRGSTRMEWRQRPPRRSNLRLSPAEDEDDQDEDLEEEHSAVEDQLPLRHCRLSVFEPGGGLRQIGEFLLEL